MSYGKLVRDKIPEIIRQNGEEPITRILSNDEYIKELERKLFSTSFGVLETASSSVSNL